MSMPKVSVYLSDDLYRRVRERDLPLSAVTQAALEEALAAEDNAAWIDEVGGQAPRIGQDVDTARLLAEVRDDFGT